jgi:hypothetical protein
MARLFLQTLYSYQRQGKFHLHAFVLMPEHLHLLLTPSEITLERAMQFIKGGYSHAVRERVENTIEIWERGFTDHRIRDAGTLSTIGCTFIGIRSKGNWLWSRPNFVIARRFRDSSWTLGPQPLNFFHRPDGMAEESSRKTDRRRKKLTSGAEAPAFAVIYGTTEVVPFPISRSNQRFPPPVVLSSG